MSSGVCCLVFLASTATSSTPAGAAISLRVTPSHGLVAGQTIAVTGRGLGSPPAKDAPTWFVTQCTTSVRGHMDPSTDTPHCDITHAKAVRLSHNGTFNVHYRVVTGIIGDGYCGTVGHATCIIVVGTATGQGAAATITFKVPPVLTGSTSTT